MCGLVIWKEVEIMSYSQKNGTRTKSDITLISEGDIWKEKIILDAIRSKRKMKIGPAYFF